jgi:TonB family protein
MGSLSKFVWCSMVALLSFVAACSTTSSTEPADTDQQRASLTGAETDESSEPTDDDSRPEADEQAETPGDDRADAAAELRGSIRLGMAQADGALDQSVVQRGIEANSRDLEVCYANALEADESVSGWATYEMEIAGDGTVDAVKLTKASVETDTVHDCVFTSANAWTFEAADDGARTTARITVTYVPFEPIGELKAEDSGDGRTNEEGAVSTGPDRSKVAGALDKDDIRKVIKKHRAEIRYCYEKELVNNPDLEGLVTMNFTVAASGHVIAAKVKNSTLNNRTVEKCMAAAIRKWVFPKPKGGGIVIINYPFNFTAK